MCVSTCISKPSPPHRKKCVDRGMQHMWNTCKNKLSLEYSLVQIYNYILSALPFFVPLQRSILVLALLTLSPNSLLCSQFSPLIGFQEISELFKIPNVHTQTSSIDGCVLKMNPDYATEIMRLLSCN